MTVRRVLLGGLLATILLLAGAGAGGGSAVGAADLNHAAVVIDPGDGSVRRFCLAFPEESITGAEALRRVESDVVFASYGGEGQAVCSLCGVGCPAGDCFCDRSAYWAYHRAGPGGAPYRYSRGGVSSTVVRDGDVEGWRWGTGEAPPPATVGEVCEVPEPPVRTASGSTTTSTTPPPTAVPPAASNEPPAASAPDGTPPPAAPVPAAAAVGATTTVALGAAVPPTPPAPEVAADPAPATSTAPDPADDDTDGSPSEGEVAASRPGDGAGGAAPGTPVDAVGAAAFVGLLGAVLAWRARLRRANVRRTTPVR